MAPCKTVEESDSQMRLRLVNSLSQSFPGSALSKALHSMNMSDDEHEDPLSSSCFSELRLEKGLLDLDDEDDEELTSLSWLHDTNLLKNIDTGDSRICESPTDEVAKENNENGLEINGGSHHQPHPSNIPYNPRKHINSKPPYSFSCLIFMAIEDSLLKRLPVKDIYAWIVNHFPYFQNAPTGWKNSVRHNLSLNKCFKKVDKEKGQSIGKGSLWCIDPDYRPNLLQALRKTPYHPYHQLQMLATPQPMTPLYQNQKLPLAPKINFNISPRLFPFLSKRLQTPTGSELDLDIDVANTLMSLKGSTPQSYSNPRLRPLSLQYDSPPSGERYKRKLRHSPYVKKRPTSPVIITSSPSEDHTYSASSSPFEAGGRSPASNTSSIDEEYDFGHESDTDDEFEESDWEEDLDSEDEEKKICEGADALLNLAGITTSSIVPMRSISPPSNNNYIKQEIKQEICA